MPQTVKLAGPRSCNGTLFVDSKKFHRFPISIAVTASPAVFPVHQPDFETAWLTPRDGKSKHEIYVLDRGRRCAGQF